MDFYRFHSIENSYRKKFVEGIRSYPTGTWCVTEKVHGSNFSFTTDGENILVGKRNSFLNDSEDYRKFFDCEELVNRISPRFYLCSQKSRKTVLR